jgi:hypothetical protein
MARFSWTQAACDECWEERNPGRTATRIRAEYATPETCVYCGEGTRSGIFVRIDPTTAPFPTREKD